jgi:general secretion pathway protein I
MTVIKRTGIKRKMVQGFTLLEILVAIAILAVAGVAVVKSSAEHLNALSVIKEMTFSAWVAENRLSELQLEPKWPPSNKKGKMTLAGREWFWRQEVEKIADKSMRKVTVYVTEQENSKESVYQLSTFLGDPK